MNNFMLLCHQG